MFIKSLKVFQNRNYLNGQPLAHFIWNHYHPNDCVAKGKLVHHKDEDTLNDWHENLSKETRATHNVIHKTGVERSMETQKKIGAANKGKLFGIKFSEERKKKIGASLLGRKCSEEHKRKISESKRGDKHPMYGKNRLEETKRKIGLGNIGKKYSDDAKKKISISLKKYYEERKTKSLANLSCQ